MRAKTGSILLPIAVVVMAMTAAAGAGADTVSLAQLDASRLLVSQRVDAYVSVTDEAGAPLPGLPRDAFRVAESADGQAFTPVQSIITFQPGAGAANGIAFLLLLDNSGSMYDTMDGRKTTDPAQMRVTHAKDAVRTFLASMTNPRDRVGLVSFNTLFTLLSPPAGQREKIGDLLGRIERPAPDLAYTELYASVDLAARAFAGIGGRKAIIVLSDGENFPYLQYSGKEHPVFKRRVFRYTEAIQACQEEGVTVYGINFGTGSQPDQNLLAVTRETGGRLFSAQNRDELAGVYEQIHRQVAQEYLVGYRATIDPAEKRYVRVVVSTPAGPAEATRFYFAGTVFGLPLAQLSALLIIPFLIAIALLWLLATLKLERKPGPARLEILQTRIGHPMTRAISLGSAKTVIGSSRKADLTIAGAPQMREQHATILKDPKDSSYTIAGPGDIMVNNQPVTTRRLESGDVIDVGGSTIVFENGEKDHGRAGKTEEKRRGKKPGS
jgi:Ca-activated chloride channel homolog